jgi:hypothetical protein
MIGSWFWFIGVGLGLVLLGAAIALSAKQWRDRPRNASLRHEREEAVERLYDERRQD